MKRIEQSLAVGVLLLPLVVSGCSGPGVDLVDTDGQQWVWPYFTYRQPTVVAFWNTYEVRCLEDLPAMNTLEFREGPVQLVSVCTNTAADRMKVQRWCRDRRVEFKVLLDPERRLAKKLKVRYFPTYILFDMHGNELERRTDIRTVQNFFDRPRWLEKATGRTGEDDLEPASY